MATAFVTGATGFIGRRLVARLASDSHAVRALVLPGEDPMAFAELRDRAVTCVRGDVTAPASLPDALGDASLVFHLAARVGDWGSDAAFARINVDGTRHVLDAAAARGCARVVMVSSIVVYGSQLATGPADEAAPREWGVGPYGRTKRASEALALDYHALGRVPVTIVRPGNVWGPRSGLWVDELVALLRAGTAVWVGDGAGDANLAFVDNVVDVLARAPAPVGAGRIYNATDIPGVSWRRYLTDLASAAAAPAPRRSLPAGVARVTGAVLEDLWRLARRPRRPLLTREAAQLLCSRAPVPCDRAIAELGYRPIPYDRALAAVRTYLEERRA
jgi:nucleoside-diphosphate-sugar epimerase